MEAPNPNSFDLIVSKIQEETLAKSEKQPSWSDLQNSQVQEPQYLAGQPQTKPPVKPITEELEEKTSSYINTNAPPHVRKLLSEIPKAFVEPQELQYKQDEVDSMFKGTGNFVTDFMNLGRGMESPSLFFVWGALWTVSTILNRNAWLKWYPSPLWPNLYVIFVAPAGICRKSAAPDLGEFMLRFCEDYHPSSVDGFANKLKIINKSTSEALFSALTPETKTFLEPTLGEPVRVERTSKITLVISELATFLGKQQYNSGLVNTLTDLYDSRYQSNNNTQGRGKEDIKDIYVTLVGNITPTGLKDSIPEEALGGGFMSRVIPVYEDLPTKIFSRPVELKGYPRPEEVAKRLAWIAFNKRGEYDFDSEAEETYDTWYRTWKMSLAVESLMEHENRMDVHIRKTALLLAACDYSTNRIVTKKHVDLAIKLVSHTLRRANKLVSELGATDFVKQIDKIRNFLKNHPNCPRKVLVHRFSRDVIVDQLQLMLTHMQQSGDIKILLNGIEQQAPSSNNKEVYQYVEIESKP